MRFDEMRLCRSVDCKMPNIEVFKSCTQSISWPKSYLCWGVYLQFNLFNWVFKKNSEQDSSEFSSSINHCDHRFVNWIFLTIYNEWMNEWTKGFSLFDQACAGAIFVFSQNTSATKKMLTIWWYLILFEFTHKRFNSFNFSSLAFDHGTIHLLFLKTHC